jgi:hypothetical protein
MMTDLQKDIYAGEVNHLQVIPCNGHYYIAAVGNALGRVIVRLYNKADESYTFGRAIFADMPDAIDALHLNINQVKAA